MSKSNRIRGRFFIRRASIAFLFSALFAFTVTGCKTGVPVLSSNGLDIIGEGAAFYLVLPVVKNRELLVSFAKTQKDADSLITAINRTSLVHAGMFKKGEDGTYTSRLLATGSFPTSASYMIFPKAKGWNRVRGQDGKKWYQNADIEASIPKSGLVFISSGNDIAAMLDNFDSPTPISLPEGFRQFSLNAQSESQIALFVPDAKNLVSLILGGDITLPVIWAEIYADRIDGETDADRAENSYIVTANVELSDTRSARAMLTLLRLTISANITLDGSTLRIISPSIPGEKLVEFASLLYLNEK